MPIGRKLMVVASVLATGVSAAFFFRKDATQVPGRQADLERSPFDQRVERRVAGEARRHPIGGTLTGTRLQRGPARRVPAAAAAAIPERASKAPETPAFQKSFNPVGALLAPIETADSRPGDTSLDGDGTTAPDGKSPVEHKIVDGDTLAQLAERYLGDVDRYLEIFDLNRDVLSTPDLLPIGTVIRIPRRSRAQAPGDESGTGGSGDVESPLVPVEPRAVESTPSDE